MRARIFLCRFALTMVTVVANALAPVARGEPTNAVLSRTTSASGQFVAYAPNALESSALCVFAERVKRAWLAELNTADSWRDPIVVMLHERDSSTTGMAPVRVDVFQNEIHLKYQITCIVPPLDGQLIATAVVRTLCEEFADRDQPTSRTNDYVRAPIPPWLALGFSESVQGRTDSLREITRRSLGAGRPLTASELVEAPLPADSSAEELYRANAWMLTEGLLSLPNGRERMRRFLAELGATKSVSNAFWLAYGTDFPGEVTLEKWWSLQLAQGAAVSVPQNLSLQETTHRLDAILPTALVQHMGEGDTEIGTQVSLDKLWRYYEKPWLRDVLKAKFNNLEMLRSEAHPFYRSAIENYLEAVALLMNRKLSRFRRAVAVADRNRIAVDQQAGQITAYLDQQERIYSAGEFTNWYSGFFQTLDQIQEFEKNRHDPISDYLDQFDR